jgi:O-antigen ligase
MIRGESSQPRDSLVKAATGRKNPPAFSRPKALGPRDLALSACGGVLAAAPLAYGAVHPWAYASLGLILALLSIVLLTWLALASRLSGDSPLTLPRPPLWGLVLAAALLVLLQLLPLPQGVVGWLSPRAVQIRALGNGYGLGPLIPLSLNSNATVMEILLAWPAVTLFFLLVFTVNSRRQIEALVFLILGVALFEALYGLWHFQSHLIWGLKNPFYLGRLCGTFINSNHAAGYLGMAVLLGFGLFLAREQGDQALTGRRRGQGWLKFWSRAEHLEPLVRRSFFLLPLLVLLVAFFFAASRGAIFALGVGLALMGLLWASQRSGRWPLYLLAAFLAAVALYSLWLGGTTVFARVMNLNDRGRTEAFWGSLGLFKEFPLVGAGLGAFDDLSYTFVPVNLNQACLVYAHNDWVQLLAETGLVGFAIVAGGWLLFCFHLIRQWRRRRDHWARGVGLGGLAALVAGAFHALGEFPFHIPAYSLTYAAIAALTFLTLHQHQHPARKFDYAAWRPAGNRLAPWLCAALILVQAVYMGQAWYFWRAEAAAPLEIDSTRIPRTLTAADYVKAMALNPRAAACVAGLAGTLAAEEITDLKQAQKIETLLQRAIFLAPARWRYHYQLGNFLLQHYRLAPKPLLSQGLKELAAATALFPEKAEPHLRLGLALTWTGLFYPGYIPPDLAPKAREHLERAAALDLKYKKFLMP